MSHVVNRKRITQLDLAEQDAPVRKTAFDSLDEKQCRQGDELPRDLFHEGFLWRDRRVPLVGAQGAFKPWVVSESPVTALLDGPYEHSFEDDHRLRYRYRVPTPGTATTSIGARPCAI